MNERSSSPPSDSSGSSGSSVSSVSEMNAQTVLDETRRELRDFLMGAPAAKQTGNSKGVTSERDASSGPSGKDAKHARAPSRSGDANGIDWVGLAKAGVSTWWRDHPLHVGSTVLKPVVADYVKRKPLATLSVAAAAGAALVLIRPWRIASVTALGMSLVRSSNLPVMAASLVATVAENLQKEQS